MSLLKTIEAGRNGRPPKIIVYGEGGVGKSTFASKAPSPIFIQTEDGLSAIDCHKFPVAKSYQEVLNELIALRDEEHDFKTVVVDSLEFLELLMASEVCRENCAPTIESVPFGKGPGMVLKKWEPFRTLLDELVYQRNMIVLLIAHPVIQKVPDPTQAGYTRWDIGIHHLAQDVMFNWADDVFFATRKMRIEKEDTGFNRIRNIAKAVGDDRILVTSDKISIHAKNRHNLPAEIPLDWSAFIAAINQQESSHE